MDKFSWNSKLKRAMNVTFFVTLGIVLITGTAGTGFAIKSRKQAEDEGKMLVQMSENKQGEEYNPQFWGTTKGEKQTYIMNWRG